MTSGSKARGVVRCLADEQADRKQASRFIGPPDVPKSQQADQALGDDAAVVRAFLSAMPDMVFRIDGEGTYLGFIPSPELAPPVPPSDFLGRKVHDVLPSVVTDRWMNSIQQVLQSGKRQSFDYQLVVLDEVHDYVALILLSGSNEVLAIVRDISERKRAEARAETERQRLETLIDTSPVGVFVADTGGQVILANREYQRIVGFSHQPEYELGRYEQAAVYRRPDGRPYELEDLPLQRALHRGETVRAEEILFEFPDGHAVPTLLDAAPVYSADGSVNGAIAIIQDMTPLEEQLGLCQHRDHRLQGRRGFWSTSLAGAAGRRRRIQ